MEKETIEHNIKELAYETLALQTLFTHLLDRLFKFNPDLARAVFDDAAREFEDIAVQGRESPHSKQAVEALRVIENMRAAAIGYHDKPKGGV